MKQCIACAEEIKHQATLCRFCGTLQSDQVSKSKPAENSTVVLWSRDAVNASWVLFGGALVWVIFGFHPNGIYGPTHPYATFSSGVAIASSILAVSAASVLSAGGKKKNLSPKANSIKRGSLIWLTISVFFALIFIPMSISYYEG